MSKKIVIVDDEAGIVEEVRDFLTDEGYDVHCADTGREGIELIKKIKPDLVLLDMKLPDMSGLDVLRKCKEVAPQTKVIVNTGYVDQKVIDETERLGRDTFLQKPFDLNQLKNELDNLLGA